MLLSDIHDMTNRYIIPRTAGTHADVMARSAPRTSCGISIRASSNPKTGMKSACRVRWCGRTWMRQNRASLSCGGQAKPRRIWPERIETASVPFATATENRMYSILGRMKAFAGPNQIVSGFANSGREPLGGQGVELPAWQQELCGSIAPGAAFQSSIGERLLTAETARHKPP